MSKLTIQGAITFCLLTSVAAGVTWAPVYEVLDKGKLPWGDVPQAAIATLASSASASDTVWNTTLDQQMKVEQPPRLRYTWVVSDPDQRG